MGCVCGAQVPGLPWYFTHCPHPKGGYDPADNIKPFFMQGHVPAAYSGQQFQVRLLPSLAHSASATCC